MNTSTTRNSPIHFPPVLRAVLMMGLTIAMTAQLVSAQSPAPVDLGAAANFGVLGGSTVTSTGATAISGDLGLSPGTAIDGFPPATVTGTIHINTPEAVNGQADLTTAYNDAAGRSTNPITVAGNIGGQTLPPGLYKSQTSLDVSSGDLTLDAQGDENAVWIFQVGSTLTTTSGRQVILTGGARASNVFWQVGTSATIGTTSAFVGSILADQSITLETGATLNGRALARIGAASLDGNSVTVPGNAPPPPAEEVTLTLPVTGTEPHGPIALPVMTSDIADKGVRSYEFNVGFDPGIITLDGVNTVGTLSEDAVVTIDATFGNITVAGVRATDFAGSGVLIYLTGTSGSSGETDLLFTEVTFNEGAPVGIGVDGHIRVSTAQPVDPVTLTLPVTGAEPRVGIALPVLTGDIANKGVLAYDFTVGYDTDVITLDSVNTVGTLSEDATVTVDTTGGRIHVVGFRNTHFSGSGVLVYLTGTASDAGTTDLTFTSLTLNNGTPEGIGVDGNIQITVGVANEDEAALPSALVLRGNYPNPFRSSTRISFDLSQAAEVQVEVFDMLGRQVMVLPSTPIPAGTDQGRRLDASALSTGTYLYRVIAISSTGTQVTSGQISLVK